jgi:hypothetical protein
MMPGGVATPVALALQADLSIRCLSEHCAAADPSAASGSNKKCEIGLARAHGWQRADVAAEPRIALIVEIDERGIHENGISTGRATVDIANEGSFDLKDCAWSADSISTREHKAVGAEIDPPFFQIDLDAPADGRPRPWRACYRSGSDANDIVRLDDADHGLPVNGIAGIGAGSLADDGCTEREPGYDQRFAQ